MNKEKFIAELRNKLKRLPSDEVENIIAYYNEYFEEATGSEEEIISELGSTSAIASQILADFAFNTAGNATVGSNKEKKSGNTIILTVLAIMAAPIALPLSIAVIALIFALFVVVFALILSAVAIGLSLFVAGVAALFSGFAVISQGPATAMVFVGGGMFTVGLAILITLEIKRMIPRLTVGTKKITQKLISKINKSTKGGINYGKK